eukprot:365948-Chlamydomonas_euryale.AAC.24
MVSCKAGRGEGGRVVQRGTVRHGERAVRCGERRCAAGKGGALRGGAVWCGEGHCGVTKDGAVWRKAARCGEGRGSAVL